MPRRKSTVPGSAGLQSDFAGEGAAGILIVACDIAKITRDHALRIAVSVVFSEKCVLVSAVGGDCSARKSEEPLGHFLVIHFFVLRSASRLPWICWMIRSFSNKVRVMNREYWRFT